MTDRSKVEVELKYRVSRSGAADRFVAADEVAGFKPVGQVRSIQHEDRYVDTTDAAIARAGFGARLRQAGNGFLISMKSLGSTSGAGNAHRREELEGPADKGMAPGSWPASAARSLVLELAGDAPLVEVVTVRQLRRKREYRRDGTLVEVSLDEVDVVVRGDVVERFEELELEVMDGDDEDLAALAAAIDGTDGLEPAGGSKLERALEAAQRVGNGKAALADVVLAHARAASPAPVKVPAAAGKTTSAATDGDGTGSVSAGSATSKPAKASSSAPGEPKGSKAERRRKADRAVEADGRGDAGQASAGGDDKPTGADDGAPPTTPAADLPDALARPPLQVGKTPGVFAEDHLAEAGRKVLRFHLAKMLAVEPGTRSGEDPEDLHKMRVATRRQRAAWRVFGDAYDAKRTKRHRNRLRDVARRLGAVRDLDVLIAALDEYAGAQAEPERIAIQPLGDSWRVRRDEARALLIKELDSPKHLDWLDDYRDFVQREGRGTLGVTPTVPHRVRDTMPSRIWAAYEGVRGYEPVLRWADIPTLHELRIGGKWLRYTLEFVREALGPDATPLIEKVVALQDHLGLLNDADVAAGLARQFLLDHAGSLDDAESAAIGRYLVDRERERARLRRTIGPAWRGVAGLTFRRQLGRVTAGL